MNVEKTIEFMLTEQARFQARSEANQARFDANFARAAQRSAEAEKRLDRIERVLTQTNRIVGRLATSGVALRSDIRRQEKAIARHEKMMAEMDGKLSALARRAARPMPWSTSLTRWPAGTVGRPDGRHEAGRCRRREKNARNCRTNPLCLLESINRSWTISDTLLRTARRSRVEYEQT